MKQIGIAIAEYASARRDVADEKRLKAILENPSYSLADQDRELLADDESSPVRLQLELMKPERYLRRQKINSTVVVFGSARVKSLEETQSALTDLEAKIRLSPGDEALAVAIRRARQQILQSAYYEEARRFSELVSRRFQEEGRRDSWW